MGTRERIVEASLELFNQRGLRSVTTNHIAAHLSISPGNLYYHFRNKEEIIREIFPHVAAATRAVLVLPEDRPVTAEDVGSVHLRAIAGIWEFRFFFRNLHELLARDPVLAETYRELQKWLVGEVSRLLRLIIAQGQMKEPDPPTDLERIATNATMLWTGWLDFVMTSRKAEITPADIGEGALQGFLSLSPYLEKRFADDVRAVIATGVDGDQRSSLGGK